MAFDPAALLKTLPTGPGIYRMVDEKNEVLYVGKARNLKKRVSSYFSRHGLATKVLAMVRQVVTVEITVTHTEREALLLESNLIKELQPRYNIQLRDDKSYPYIFISEGEPFPRLSLHRGARREKGRYFGPYPSAASVRESLHLMQKIFPVRQCENTFFANRSRPCLQYQIKRCTAPCVGLIDRERYAEDVRHAVLFLDGKSRAVIEDMVQRMEQAALRQDYERAALYRDRIADLRRVQEKQYVTGHGGDADVLAIAVEHDTACVQVMFIRGGRNLGTRAFFPKAPIESTAAEILAAFLPQYYLGKVIPPQLYVNELLPGREVIEQAFSEQAGGTIRLQKPTRGAPRRWAGMAELNARDALRRRLASQANIAQRLEALREALRLEALPERLECFDISHTFGEAPVGACVVFDRNGPLKSDYRRYNIEGVAPGDDYGALRQALERRYRRIMEGEGRVPDVLFIDGGKGQVGVAREVLDELAIGEVCLIGIAKGESRKPGREQLFLSGKTAPTILPADSAALHLIQQIRDEAHRFAITAHRGRRARARNISPLEGIPGIGERRRQALLKNLGGMREVQNADVEALARVPGIDRGLAQRIYDTLHDET